MHRYEVGHSCAQGSTFRGNKGMTERRTARRYDLSLPVSIRVAVEDEAILHTGKTRDISTRGVYFIFDNGLNAGAELDLTMTLPAEVTRSEEHTSELQSQ